MKKIKVLLALLVMLVLTGCMRVQMVMEFDEDGKVTMSSTMMIEESMLGMTDGDSESLKESFFKDYSEDEYTFKEVNEEIDGTKYVGWTATAKESIDINEGGEQTEGIGVKDGVITIKMPTDFITSSFEEGFEEGSEGMDIQTLISSGLKFDMIFKFKGDIVSTNGTMSEDKKSVKFDVLTFDKDTIEVVANLAPKSGGSNNMLLYIVVGAAVVAGVAGVVFFMKKNKDSTTDDSMKDHTDTVIEEVEVEVVEPVKEELEDNKDDK